MHCLSNKISFLSYSIFNLLFTEQKLGASPLGESLSIIPHLSPSCQAFFQTFFGFFVFFYFGLLKNLFQAVFCFPRDSLSILPYLFPSCQLFLSTFFYFFRGFFAGPYFFVVSPFIGVRKSELKAKNRRICDFSLPFRFLDLPHYTRTLDFFFFFVLQ